MATSTARNFNSDWPIYLNFSNMINLCQIFDPLKIPNVSNLFFEKKSHHKTQIFHLFKGRYFVMGGPIDMSFGVFWGTSVGFLVWFCNFSRNIAKVMSIWMLKVGQNSTTFKKYRGCFSVFYLDVTCRTQKLSWMTLVKFVKFVVLKILDNLVSMQNSLNVHNCRRKQNFETCPTYPYL